MIENPLIKYNKLKRFSAYVADKMKGTISEEIEKTDCLFNNDIYTRRDMFEKLDLIADCASLVELRKYETGEFLVYNANYCHNPVVCPVCADRVSKRRRAIFSQPIKRAVRRFSVSPDCGDWRPEYPKRYTGVYMATATIKDSENLKDRIDCLVKSLRRMRLMGQKRLSGRSLGEWSKVRAGIANIEIKIGSSSNQWHVHCHMLLFTDSPLDIRLDGGYFYANESGNKIAISKLNHEWYTATKGQGINFDIQPLEYRETVRGRDCKTFEESIEAQAQEVIKYSTSLSAKKGTGILTALRYVELIQRRGNRRLFNTLGLLRCDKRNPESFISISERELQRLEYIEELDSKRYSVYASLWQHGGAYGEPAKMDYSLYTNSEDKNSHFINIKQRAFVAQTAIYQGAYRKERNGILKSREGYTDKNIFEKLLDDCRDMFKMKIAILWQDYNNPDFLPEFLTDFNSSGFYGFRQRYNLNTA